MADESKDYTKAEFIDEADRLKMENLHLQLQNLNLKQQLLKHEGEDLAQDTQNAQLAFVELRRVLDKKYGLPLTSTAIDKSGRLLRLPTKESELALPLPLPTEN